MSQDILSTLPDVLLILIISHLSFKDCVKTCTLKKRWRNLCRETKNVTFKESEYVVRPVSGEEARRNSFVHYMRQWVSRFHGQAIESFEICLSNPVGFEADIESLVEFAVSRQVKNLALDFSNPTWGRFDDVSRKIVVQLPECVYNLTTLESLKIYACDFDPLRFANPGMLRSLSIGWICLLDAKSLISRAPFLESLSINHCWELDITEIAGQMREFVFEDCDFPYMQCSFDLPKVDIFKYSGYVFCFHFERMNKVIKEVCLDFGLEREYDEPTESTRVDGEAICGYLNDLRSARTLTVCPYLLQAIQENENPVYLLRPAETQHLLLKTKLQPKEFVGISMLLNNCPDLETLTFDILPPNPFVAGLTYRGIDADTYWLQDTTYKCLSKTLKVVEVMNFSGVSNELNMLKYLIRYGSVLQRIDIYLLERQKVLASAGAEMLQRISNRVEILVHNA